MKCPRCGMDLSERPVRCPGCGAKIRYRAESRHADGSGEPVLGWGEALSLVWKPATVVVYLALVVIFLISASAAGDTGKQPEDSIALASFFGLVVIPVAVVAKWLRGKYGSRIPVPIKKKRTSFGWVILVLGLMGVLLALVIYPIWDHNRQVLSENEAYGVATDEQRDIVATQTIAVVGGFLVGAPMLLVGAYLVWSAASYNSRIDEIVIGQTLRQKSQLALPSRQLPCEQRATKSKFCRYCGTQIPADSMFCESCGQRIDFQKRP